MRAESKLVDGFIIENNEITHAESGTIIADISITALNFSTRAINCLFREYQRNVMISDVLRLTEDDLVHVRNMGLKTANEIIEKTRAYMESACDLNCKRAQMIPKTIAPEYEVVNGVITNVENRMVVPDVSISTLPLSNRAYHCFLNYGITRLSQLVLLTPEMLGKFPNMGAKTISEISEFIPTYLNDHQRDDLPGCNEENEQPCQEELIDDAVVAEDYVVTTEGIVHKQTKKVIPDADIDALNLSVRPLRCMISNGKTRISDLIGMPYEELRGIRNLGVRSINEIQEKLEQYLERASHEVSSAIMEADAVLNEVSLLKVMTDKGLSMIMPETIAEFFPDTADTEIQTLLQNLQQERKIQSVDDGYRICYPIFAVYVYELTPSRHLNERMLDIVRLRLDGYTLEEVGQYFGTTRERIRQIEKKTIDRITYNGTKHFEEDQYSYLFTHYAIEKECFLQYLCLSKGTWYYLCTCYKQGVTDMADAIDDQLIPKQWRRDIERYIHRKDVKINGRYIPVMQGVSAIAEYLVEQHCKEEMTIDEFYPYYETFVRDNNLDLAHFELTSGRKNTIKNSLSESNKVLWKQNQRMRYYDIVGGDYQALLDTLDLGQYENIELSTRKFFIEYPQLMEQYDLRDEYELHNLLKKIHAETENQKLSFARMPNLVFGTFDREEAVKEYLYANAPISGADLVQGISQIYGHNPVSIQTNWLPCISLYYRNGYYKVDQQQMPQEQMEMLKAALTDDFYYFTDVQKIYKELISDADVSLISAYNLKRMGFVVGTTYILQNYETAESYFRSLLLKDDIVDVKQFNRKFTYLTTYTAYLQRLRKECEIIEFEPYKYINIRRLQKMGIEKEQLRMYAEHVKEFIHDDDYFSIQSMKKAGFVDELDMLGFDDIFYASLLKYCGWLSWQRIGNAVIFNPQNHAFSICDFLVDQVEHLTTVDLDDFADMLKNDHNINLTKWDIIEKIRGSDLYYDRIMGKIYANYEIYFEEI